MSFRLIPADRDLGWTPYVFLIYLVFVFLGPLADNAGTTVWIITSAAVLLFLPLYFWGYWVCGWRALIVVCGITALGGFLLPFNGGAIAFFIYAAAFLGFLFEPAAAFKLLACLLAVFGLECYLVKTQPWIWIDGVVISVVVGLMDIYFGQQKRTREKLRLAKAEIEHLAKVAERERIARDLHDVLGHTLSVIVLKSELASKLIDRDLEKARKEIAEVEQTARAALAEIRQAVGGYRAGTIQEEFARARSTLETAGVSADCAADALKLTPAQETVLALITREAVTNVVRHAKASLCRLRLERDGASARLEIQDDGRGGGQLEGNGIRGMRERIEALHGRLDRDTAAGTRLTVTLPLA
jgi:two-component system, NarL family, sensor histidine kinase DesK